MATKAPFFSVAPLLLLATLASASIEDFYTKAATRDEVINYDFCVESIQAAQGGSSADDRGLAVIAGKLASQKAQATLPKIDELLKNAGLPAEKAPLQDCRELYDDAIEDLRTAADFASKNRYVDANTYFTKGIDAATTCDDGFWEHQVHSSLAAEDNELNQLSSIRAFITYTGP